MNELYFPGGVSTENISGSNEILTYDSNSKIISSGFNVDFLSDYELFYNSTSQSWDSGADITMILNTQVRGHSNYNVVSNEVSVGESGEYIIEADITITALSGGRKNSFSWLELNGIEIAGTRISCYERISPHGASGTTRTIIDLTPSDSITIVTARNVGSGDLQQIVNGTRLFIKRGF